MKRIDNIENIFFRNIFISLNSISIHIIEEPKTTTTVTETTPAPTNLITTSGRNNI